MTVVVTFAVVTNMTNSNTYERVNLSSTCSLELPKIDFTESNSNTNGGNSYVQVNTDYKQLSSNNLIIGYMKIENSLGVYGNSSFNMADQFKAGHTDWYSRTVSNDATGETVLVMGKDKEQVDKIADSLKFTGGNKTGNNNTVVEKININDSKTPIQTNQTNKDKKYDGPSNEEYARMEGYSSYDDYLANHHAREQAMQKNPTPEPSPAPSNYIMR